jgi:hypothetical protein
MTCGEEELGFGRGMAKAGRGHHRTSVGRRMTFHHFMAAPHRTDGSNRCERGWLHHAPRRSRQNDPDPQPDRPTSLLNAVMTESGRIKALDQDLLDRVVQKLGGAYQAFLS